MNNTPKEENTAYAITANINKPGTLNNATYNLTITKLEDNSQIFRSNLKWIYTVPNCNFFNAQNGTILNANYKRTISTYNDNPKHYKEGI